jgi:hypothetical protein
VIRIVPRIVTYDAVVNRQVDRSIPILSEIHLADDCFDHMALPRTDR